jgi:acetoin:2,6-dichlorophenolindophenol oxidoreductase subunit alpha
VTLASLTRLADGDLAMALRIRQLERSLLDLYAAGQIAGTVHTCLGQEYIPVALAPLTAGDFIFSNHRGHGHYLAHFDDLEGILAEILGRHGAVCHGVGGSQHLFREDGFISTGVQGESLPVAVGVALHFRRTGAGRAVVVYLGDGSWGEGAVYEALNLASLWRLPVVVVVEHNGIAQSTPTELQLAGTIGARARAFDIEHREFRTCDINEIRAGAGPLIDSARREPRPIVLEFATTRLGPHSKGDDTRSVQELSRLAELDWLRRYAAAFESQFAAADAAARSQLERVVGELCARPRTDWRPPGGV